MLTKEQAKKLIEKTLSFSTFPDCEARIDYQEKSSVRFALNSITTSGFTTEQWMTITSERDGQSGTTSLSEFDERTLREAVKLTEQLALLSPRNPERAEPVGPQKYPELENFAESTAKARNEAFIPHIRAIIEAAKAKDLVAAGFFERAARAAAIANKQGNFSYGQTADSSLSTTIRAIDGSSSGWASQPAVRIEEIDGAAVGRSAMEKCLRWKNPKRLDPGKYTVVLEAAAAGDLVERLSASMDARTSEEGRSFLSRKGGGTLLGEKLFPEWITLRTDPFHKLYSGLPWAGGSGFQDARGGGSRSIGGGGGGGRRGGTRDRSGEALPAARVDWIEKGTVRNLHYGRYWAHQAGKEPTPAPNRLVLEGQDKSLADLIASVERGLLVTHFFYIRELNPQTLQLTGLTRDGLFLIENGKATSPVVNFRFNESPVRLLKNTLALGTPVRAGGGEGGGMIAPPLVAKDFTFASISDAV
jgi:predicted Zn-dependent protease